MTGPAVTPDPRILANLQRLKDAGAPDDALEAYLNEENAKGAAPSAAQRQLHARDVARRMTSANEADAASVPSYPTAALGGLAALARNIPGMEAVQAGARSLDSHMGAFKHRIGIPFSPDVKPQSYTDALHDIRGAEADNPASGANSLIGGTIAAGVMPGGPVASGALYGGAEGLLAADPMSIGERATRTAVGAGIGALIGKVLPAAATYAGSKFKPTLGAQHVAREAAMGTADEAAYGLAAEQGAAAGSSPAITKVFAEPDIKPFVDLVKGSRKYAGADDATVLREVYKQMSREQTGLTKRLGEQGYDAATALRAQNIGLAKKQLLNAAEAPWTAATEAPSIATAQSPNPSLSEALDSFRQRSAEAARRATGGAQPNPNPFSSQPSAETVAQRSAREMLERSGAEGVVSPALSGAPGPRMLMTEHPGAMTALRGAIKQHAAMSGEEAAMEQGADVANRILSNARIGGKKLGIKSPEAFARDVKDMTPGEAQAAIDGILGRMKEFRAGLTMNPLSIFGTVTNLPKNISRASKLYPYVSLLQQQAGSGGVPTRLMGAAAQSGAAGLLGP